MANITPGEARVGYSVYLAANGDISADELQAQLDQLGAGKLSDRMYRHYRALYAAGYDHYIAINRFDILQAAEPYTNESANSRYSFSELGQAVQVTVLHPEPFTFLAIATRVSDAGLSLDVTDPDVGPTLTKGAHRISPGDYLRVDFLEAQAPSANGRLVDKPERYPSGDRWLLEVEFNRLRSVVEFVQGDSLPADVCPVRLVTDDGDSVAADVLGRRLFHLLDAIENARSLLNQAMSTDDDFADRAPPAEITYVKMDSPLEVVLGVPIGVVTVVGFVWQVLKHLPVAYKQVEEGRLVGAQARTERAVAESHELDNMTKRAAVLDVLTERAAAHGAVVNPAQIEVRRLDQTLAQLEANLLQLEYEDVEALDLPESAQVGEVEEAVEAPSVDEDPSEEVAAELPDRLELPPGVEPADEAGQGQLPIFVDEEDEPEPDTEA